MSEPKRLQLWCPHCGTKHIDRGLWATTPHHKHKCEHCSYTWDEGELSYGVEGKYEAVLDAAFKRIRILEDGAVAYEREANRNIIDRILARADLVAQQDEPRLLLKQRDDTIARLQDALSIITDAASDARLLLRGREAEAQDGGNA